MERVRTLLRLLLVVMISVVAELVVSIGSARFTSEPEVFVVAGFLGYWIVFIAGARWVVRRRRQHRGVGARAITAMGILAFLVFSASILIPYPAGKSIPSPKGIQYWDLSPSIRIAYLHIAPTTPSHKPPIIFLHGGPGVPDLNGDAAYFGQLAKDGYDVYVYDQVGSGASSRLSNPLDYTIARNVADLEEIRKKIGAPRVILIGHSYGSEVLASYMAKYGSHVEKAVFSSPGPLSPTDHSGGNLLQHLTTSQRWRLYVKLLQPRLEYVYALLQVNPEAAHAIAGNREMDHQFSEVYNLTRAALHCQSKGPGPKLYDVGFYAHQTPQSPAFGAQPDPVPQLKKQQWSLPVLILKGRCDYLSWSSAQTYRRLFPNSQLVVLNHAGHNSYQDDPRLFMRVLTAFLASRPLPLPVYTASSAPTGYGQR